MIYLRVLRRNQDNLQKVQTVYAKVYTGKRYIDLTLADEWSIFAYAFISISRIQ